jgi:hypothetical protein
VALSSAPVVSVSDYGRGRSAVARRWITELELAAKETRSWETRFRAIEKRYRDDRMQMQDARSWRSGLYRFNVLWSNVQTLLPAIYARPPKPVVVRRFRDRDPIGRAASQIVERGLDYMIECSDLHQTVRQAVEDFLIGGRGQVWLSYYRKSIEPDSDRPAPDYEEVRCDYVFWADFQMSPARTWKEVRWVARREYMTRDQLRERFPRLSAAQIEAIPLDWRPDHLNEQDVSAEHQAFLRTTVWEIWNKDDRRVYWICPGYGDAPLDEQDDPLNLEGFFPCPRPLLATTTNGTMVPVPDYAEYQDQAEQLDELTCRIGMVTRAVKVAGLYPGDERDIVRLFNEGVENELLPVTNWASFMDKGGLERAIALMPTEKIAGVLKSLVDIRSVIKNDLYEVTGIADIVRGSTQPSETATAQQIKGRYATMRLSDKQQEVARFVRDILRIMAEIMCEQFSPQTLLLMSDYALSDDPGPDGQQKVFAALQLLRDDKLRGFRIDIEDESTIAVDEQADKAARLEFLQAVSAYLRQAVPAGQQVPELAPLLGKMLLFGVRAFRSGRDMETSIENALAELEDAQRRAAGQPKPPSPQEVEMQAKMQEVQMRAAEAQQRSEAEAYQAQLDNALEMRKLELQEAEAARKHEFAMADLELRLRMAEAERQKAEREVALKERAQQAVEIEAARPEREAAEMAARLEEIEAAIMETAQTAATAKDGHEAVVKELIRTLSSPRRIIRGPDGRAVGVELVTDAPNGLGDMEQK